jgi:hypothetical protein
MFTEPQKKEILAKILEKTKGQLGVCPICRNPQWTLNDGIVSLIVQENVHHMVIGGPTLPCVSMTCVNCGNTQLLNLLILGLGDILGVKAAPIEKLVENTDAARGIGTKEP